MDLDEMQIPTDDVEVKAEETSNDISDTTAEDLYNALSLLQDNLTFLEGILKEDLSKKFLERSNRSELMTHCGELMTFLDQFTFDDPC